MAPVHRRSLRHSARLRGAARGLSTVEYVVVLVLLACVGIGAWRLFGASVKRALEGSNATLDTLGAERLDAVNDLRSATPNGNELRGVGSSERGTGSGQRGVGSGERGTGTAARAASPRAGAEQPSSPAGGTVSEVLSGVAHSLLPGRVPSTPPSTAALPASAARGAATEAKGPTLLATGVDIATDFVPYVSNVKDATIAITGVNPITGEHVGTVGRVLAGVFAIPGAGNAAKYLSKGAKYALKGGKAAYEAAEAARASTKLATAVGKSVERELAAGAAERVESQLVGRTEQEVAERAEKKAAEATAAAEAAKEPGTAIQTYWPPNRGFAAPPTAAELPVGTQLDRYGSEFGTFTAPKGTPFEMRALPAEAASSPLRAYEVMKPLPAQAGAAAPWFGQVGGGMQYEFSQSIESLVKDGYLRRLP